MATILVVDDERSIVETLEELLTWDGHTVLTAENGERALLVLDEQRPDMLLMDFMMPVKDGLQVLAEVRRRPELADLPVILMTAAPMSIPPSGPRFDRLLVKPFTVERLREALKAVLPAKP